MTGATILAGAGASARARELCLPQPGPKPGLWFIQCFLLCLEYIAKQAICILTPHVNAVNGVT